MSDEDVERKNSIGMTSLPLDSTAVRPELLENDKSRQNDGTRLATLGDLDGSRRIGTDSASEEEAGVEEREEMPNGGYGWVIVGCMMAMNACTWGESPCPSFSSFFTHCDGNLSPTLDAAVSVYALSVWRTWSAQRGGRDERDGLMRQG
jgi:hypothetical protein